MKNIEYVVGFIVGLFLVAGVAVVISLILTSKDRKLKRKYDERQELIRGKGFKYAFYTVITLNMIYGVLSGVFENMSEELPVNNSVMCVITIFIGVAIYAWYCIMNGAYIAINENPKKIMICFLLVGIINLVVGISSVKSGMVVEDGRLTIHCSNILCAALMFATILVMLIKRRLDKREE